MKTANKYLFIVVYYPATRYMTTFDDSEVTTNGFQVSWTPPKFLPYMYKQTTSCKLVCDDRTYYLTEVMMDSDQVSSVTRDLLPWSECLIKLIAVYNPTSIDPGIGLTVRTLYTSNC